MLSHSPAPVSLADLPVFPAARLKPGIGGGSWRFDSLVGILAEISEEVPSGAVSFAADIIAEAHARSEPVAWVAGTESIFFPPDLAKRGVDLSAVVVVRPGGETDTLTAAEWLVGSGAMGLVIVDLGEHGNVSDAPLGRILKLAEANRCAVVFLTRKRRHDPSLGSRISLRGCITRHSAGAFSIVVHTVKDKRSNSSSPQTRQYHGPAGMH
jgi:recombination protein RecA